MYEGRLLLSHEVIVNPIPATGNSPEPQVIQDLINNQLGALNIHQLGLSCDASR